MIRHESAPIVLFSIALIVIFAFAGCSSNAPPVQSASPETQQTASAETTNAEPSAADRMSKPGAEELMLARRTGLWDVVATVWPAPGAEPIVTAGVVAERNMIGTILQEVMRPDESSTIPDFQRIDYLSYDRVEGRWKYVSLDTRLPVSIMPAWSFAGEKDGVLTMQFEPQGFVGFGEEVEGKQLRSDMIITRQNADRELKQQHFILADGGGKEWLAVQHEYTRRGEPE